MNVALPFSTDSAEDSDVYEPVDCPACARLHLINKSTGKLLGNENH
jgi:hypothetical protein